MNLRTPSLRTAVILVNLVYTAGAWSPQSANCQGYYSGAVWTGGPASPGDWFDSVNWNPDQPGPFASATIDNGGTAVIAAGHAEALGGSIGFYNTGALRITGGSAQFHWSVSLGLMPGSRGELRVESGALDVAGNLQVGGAGGRGEVIHTGGGVRTGPLVLGGQSYFYAFPASPPQPEDYGRGHYRLTGGTLHTTHATIGNSGVGRFIQDGGRAEIVNTLRIGGQISELPGFDVLVPPLQRRSEGIALATNHTATLSVPIEPVSHSDVVLDSVLLPTVPSRGLYELNDGELIAGNMLVDRTGVYRQTGGTSEFDHVAIHADGQFRLRGGQLHAERGFHSDEAVHLNGRVVALSVGAGILDLSSGIAGAQNAHIAAGLDSLTILPAGFDANSGFGTFNRQGIVHVAGNNLILSAGKRIAGAGVIDDFVTARGEIAAAGYGINLSKGLRLQPGAAVNLGDGALAAVGRATTVQGGTLSAKQLVVGGTLTDPWERQFQRNSYYWPFDNHQLADAPGVVRHSAGKVEIADRATVLSGVYRISGGELDAQSIDVGVNQWFGKQEEVAARFVQTGGTVRTTALSLSQTYFYPLAFHTIDDLGEPYAHGTSTDDGPIVWVPEQSLVFPLIGPTAIDASYRLEAGELIADEVYLSHTWVADSTARFVQTGGRLVSSRRIFMHGPDTSYIMEGGQLTARRFEIGSQFVLNDPSYVVPDSATFAVRDADSQIEIRGELLLGGGSRFRAVSGTTIRMTNPEPLEHDWQPLAASSFRNLSFDSDNLSGLKNLTLVFDGHTNQFSTFEVAGLDLGPGAGGYQHNFALAGLHLGGDAPAFLQLVDLIDNRRNGDFNESLYVDTLIVGAGSTLDLGGLNLYYRHATIAGEVIASGGAMFAANVPEPGAIAMMLTATLAVAAISRQAPLPRRGQRLPR